MNEVQFIIKHKSKWEKLGGYNAVLSKKGVGIPEPGELREYAELLRTAGRHLAYSRTHFAGSETENYLNDLVGVSQALFYRREKFKFVKIINYFAADFPAALKRERRLFLLSAAVFFTGLFFVYFLCAAEPRFLRFFTDDSALNEGAVESWLYPLIGGFVFSNNIRVALTAFAFGLFAGVGTVYILLANGGMIGAYAYAALSNGGDPAYFFSLILPHGITELCAVFISGAAGLMIGRAVLIPGDHLRRDSVKIAARKAVFLIPGVAVMLLFAGLAEGFFTPLDIDIIWKFTFAALTALLLMIYFIFAGKPRGD